MNIEKASSDYFFFFVYKFGNLTGNVTELVLDISFFLIYIALNFYIICIFSS